MAYIEILEDYDDCYNAYPVGCSYPDYCPCYNPEGQEVDPKIIEEIVYEYAMLLTDLQEILGSDYDLSK